MSGSNGSHVANGGNADPLAALLDRVLDDESGIVRSLMLTPVQSDEPPLFVGMAEMVDTFKLSPRRLSRETWQHKARAYHDRLLQARTWESDVSANSIYASGAGLTRDVALWSTVGEALERYAMGVYVHGFSVQARAADLPAPPIDVSKLILFDEEQYARSDFPFARYEARSPRQWTPAVDLVDGAATFVPTELAAVGKFDGDPAPVLDNLFSTGCAAGPTYARALFSGLCEVVERDAFMFYWLTATPPPRLDIEALRSRLPPALGVLLDFPHMDISLRWLRSDIGLPTVGCFVRPQHARGFACGASCNPDWKLAVEKAVVEAFHTLNWTVNLDRESSGPMEPEHIQDFRHHVEYYLEPSRHGSIEFLMQDDGPDATAEFLAAHGSAKSLKAAVHELHAQGYTPVAVDRTFDDLESVDIRVAHVFVPGLQPLHVGCGTEHRDRRRLARVAESLGIRMPAQLNFAPHPFP